MVTISELLASALDELASGRHPDAPLLTGPSGGWLTRQQAGRIVRDLGIDAGIERPVCPHLLRHGFVSIALEARVPLSAVGEGAGHCDLPITPSKRSTIARTATPIASALRAKARNQPLTVSS